MDNLVMTKHQDKVFLKSIDHRKGDHPLMIAPIDRLFANVSKTVLHPPHVPLEAEPEPSRVGRPGNSWPRGRFLSDGGDAGEALIADFVAALHESDRIKILTTA